MTKQIRALSLQPSSVDENARTVEVVWTSGAKVKRMDYDGIFTEELIVSDEAIDLSRLKAGAPVLNTHSSWSTDDVLGVVEDAWLADGKGYARLRFSERDSVTDIWNDVKSGVLRNLSVGYGIDSHEMIIDDDGNRTLKVTGWTPHEISVVPVPADAESQFRKLDDTSVSEVAIEDENDSENKTGTEAVEAETEEAPVNTPAEPVAASRAKEGDYDDLELEDEGQQTPPEAEDKDPKGDAPEGAETETEVDEASQQVSPSQQADEAPAQSPALGERSVSANIVRACVEAGQPERAADFIERGMHLADVKVRLAETGEIRKLCQRFQLDATKFDGLGMDEVRAQILDKLVSEDVETQARFAPVADDEPAQKRSKALSPANIYSRYREGK